MAIELNIKFEIVEDPRCRAWVGVCPEELCANRQGRCEWAKRAGG